MKNGLFAGFLRHGNWNERWEWCQSRMNEEPPGGYQYCSSDVETAKELVLFSAMAAPEEWEGGDRVSSSLKAVCFLLEVFPDAQLKLSNPDQKISLLLLRRETHGRTPDARRIVWLALKRWVSERL
jgi:hypothetical protein